MSRLPVIIAQGGISPAGRTSGFHGYRRLVLDKLSQSHRQETLEAIRVLRNLSTDSSEAEVLSGTLIRRLETNLFDSQAIYYHHPVQALEGTEMMISGRRLPDPLPEGWQAEKLDNGQVKITMGVSQKLMVPATRKSPVNAAGQLPSGFAPEKLYQSRHHPRSLSMTIYGASDAGMSSGLQWQEVKQHLAPEEIAVYAGSAMSQLDYNGNGGMLQARLLGKRVTSKQCPLGFAEMSADFINAYIMGSMGATGTSMGACATLLYNLQMGVADIRSGRRRLVVVGNSEAPITSEIMDGYSTMGALATDASLRELDGLGAAENPDWRKSCRPFGMNSGFTIAESSQYLVLMDDELALECGADILGAVPDVFVNADGFKKSISAPGAGNYLTVARAAALGRAIVGEDALRYRSFVQAHGTGTPQNRVSESHILNETAKQFGIQNWAVSAVKSYVGHSLGAAAGDQIMSALGVWQYGWVPGIRTISNTADDVYANHLNILTDHLQVNKDTTDLALINAKGFGGNNASALLLSPTVTRNMLKAKHGGQAMTEWQHRYDNTRAAQQEYEQYALSGEAQPVYQFGEGVLSNADLDFNDQRIKVPGYGCEVNLVMDNPFWSF